jgi:hypothetical protein
MLGLYQRVEEYFLTPYRNYPSEIQKKIRNLLFINLINLSNWGFIFFLSGLNQYIMDFDVLMFIRDFLVLLLIITSFRWIKTNKPILAGTVIIAINLLIVVHAVLSDMLGLNAISIQNLYRTLAFLLIGNLFVILVSIKQSQILIYNVLSVIILYIHAHTLIIALYGLSPANSAITITFEVLLLIIVAGIVSFFLFGMTLRTRMGIIHTIVFYKMSTQGPELLFSEQGYDSDDESKEDELLRAGVYFYTAIGQGSSYRTGLFGPVPCGVGEEKVALIYSELVKDTKLKDDRLKGKNYLLIAFITNEHEVALIHKNKLLELVQKRIDKIGDISDLTEEDFRSFIHHLRTQ